MTQQCSGEIGLFLEPECRRENRECPQKLSEVIAKWGRIKTVWLLLEICSQCFNLPTVFGAGFKDQATSHLLNMILSVYRVVHIYWPALNKRECCAHSTDRIPMKV